MRTASDQVPEALCSIFALLNIGRWTVEKPKDFKCNVQSSEQCTFQRSALFWNFTQRSMVVLPTLPDNLSVPPSRDLRVVPKKSPYQTTIIRCVKSTRAQISFTLRRKPKVINSVEFVRAFLVDGN